MPSLFTPKFQIKKKNGIVIRQPKERDPTLSWFVLCIIALVMMKLSETEIVKENYSW